MVVLIRYPYLIARHVGTGAHGTEFYFGNTVPPDLLSCHVVETDLNRPCLSGKYLLLEPPSVSPDNYAIGFRRIRDRIFSFSGPWLPNVTQIRSPWPFGWPELPDEPDRTPWEERIDGVVWVAGAKGPSHPVDDGELYTRRLRLAVELHAAGVRVDWYGRPGPHGNTQPGSIWPFYKGECPGDATEKRKLMAKYRFALCWENWSGPGYVTEKLPDALASGCIPIYRTQDGWVLKHLYRTRECYSLSHAVSIIRQANSQEHAIFLDNIDLPAIRRELSPQPLFDIIEKEFI